MSSKALPVLPDGTKDFASLRRFAQSLGLFDRQAAYYVWKVALTLLMLVAGMVVLVITDNLWIHLLDAAFLALVYGQIGLLFHDAGHRQIFSSSKRDDIVGYACAFAMGESLQSWIDVHNEHHAHPNREDSDPDISLPFFAYSEKQAAEAWTQRNAFLRFIISHQHALYFPLLCFTAFTMRMNSWKYLVRNRAQFSRLWIDWAACIVHMIVYFTLVFTFMPVLNGVLFVVVHQALWGLYIGSIFAPNHKGMPVIDNDSQIDYLTEQVITSRNVRSHPIIDFLYGGLNYQVEHHLFPNMPRNKLRQANALVKEYCKRNGIPYHETGVIRSYQEIVGHMKEIAMYFRKCKPA